MSNKKQNNDNAVTSEGYDSQGLTIERVLKNHLWWERMPYGMHWKKPPLKEFLMLWLHHRFGYYIISAKVWINKRLKR